MIVFLSCVKLKRDVPSRSEDMYVSDLFKKSLQYAKSLNPDHIYILSAKYGLLELDDVIEPYDLTLKTMSEKERKRWAFKVCKQFESKGGNYNDKAIFLCGLAYRKYIMTKFPNKEIPLEGLMLGEQLQFYKNQRR